MIAGPEMAHRRDLRAGRVVLRAAPSKRSPQATMESPKRQTSSRHPGELGMALRKLGFNGDGMTVMPFMLRGIRPNEPICAFRA
jgi:hypothetical protein